MNPVVESLLLRSAVLFLMLGSLAGLIVGGLLIQSPFRLRKIGDILNRWVSTRHLDQTLDRSIDIDPWFYRHHRVCSGLILLASDIYPMHLHSVWIDKRNHRSFQGLLFAAKFNWRIAGRIGVKRLVGCFICGFCQFVFVTASQHAA